MLSVAEARELILARIFPVQSTTIPLEQAAGRILAGPIIAEIDLPSFDNSSVDGFAVCAADVASVHMEHPATLRGVGDIPAGKLAKIPEKLLPDTFPFDRQPKLNKEKMLALYDSMAFLKDKQKILWMGGTGVGKTGLATGFLIQAIHQGGRGRYVLFADLLHELHRSQADRSQARVLRRYLEYDILLVDEIGYVDAEPTQVGRFFTLLQNATDSARPSSPPTWGLARGRPS